MTHKYDKFTEEWSRLYLSGLGCDTIATQYECSQSAVIRCLRRNNVIIRRLGNRGADYIEYRPAYHFFDIIDTEEKAYWLGFIYADGNVSPSSYSISVSLKIDDISHVEKLAHIFGARVACYNNNGTYNKHGDMYMSRCVIASKHTTQMLIGKGIYPGKSYIDSTEIFSHIPSELMHHFIRGIFDGDGSIGLYGKQQSLTFCGRKSILEMIRNIIISDTACHKGYLRYVGGCYTHTWGGRFDIIKIGRWMYNNATIYLIRKKDVYDKITGTVSSHNALGILNECKLIQSRSNTKNRINELLKCIGVEYAK